MRIIARSLMLIAALAFTGCPKDEPPPPKPPVLGDVEVQCADADGQDYQVVSLVTVEITDEDRDLLVDSINGSVNGLNMELEDGASIDDIFEWAPPSSWDPPMICRGDFRFLITAEDASGIKIDEKRVVTK